VGPISAHREREPRPETHRAHDLAGVLRVRWHQLQGCGGACGIVSGTDRRASLAVGGTETSPIDGTYRRAVRNPFPLERPLRYLGS
jgi:hypothetical protein